MSPPVIQAENVSFSYGSVPVLEEISLEVEQGEFLGLVGPNGGGKTTLLRILLGLLTPDTGRVRLLGKAPAEARRRVGYVPQFATFETGFPISVEETVLLGRLGRRPLIGRYDRADREAAERALADTETAELRGRAIGTLSGGQLQRVLLARALACDPELLILDEPTANIDLRVEEDIFSLLRKLGARMTVLVVSHDIGFISHYVTRVACLNRTLLCHRTEGPGAELLRKLYGSPVRAIPHDHRPEAP